MSTIDQLIKKVGTLSEDQIEYLWELTQILFGQASN